MKKAILLAFGIAAMLGAIALASIAAAQNNTTHSKQADASAEEEGVVDDDLTTVANATAATVSGKNATISTTSTAKAEVEPDKVIILLTIETKDQDVGDAVKVNSQTVNKVIKALFEAGVNENETSTSGFVVYPNYDFNNYTEFGYQEDTGEITGYTAANTIQIESRKLENASSWIDAAIQAGANRVDKVVFTLSDEVTEKIKANLIVEAVGKAETRAEVLASALDTKIVRLKEAFLEDYYDFSSLPYEFDYSYYSSSGVPLIPPKQTVSMTVHLTYLVERARFSLFLFPRKLYFLQVRTDRTQNTQIRRRLSEHL